MNDITQKLKKITKSKKTEPIVYKQTHQKNSIFITDSTTK